MKKHQTTVRNCRQKLDAACDELLAVKSAVLWHLLASGPMPFVQSCLENASSAAGGATCGEVLRSRAVVLATALTTSPKFNFLLGESQDRKEMEEKRTTQLNNLVESMKALSSKPDESDLKHWEMGIYHEKWSLL